MSNDFDEDKKYIHTPKEDEDDDQNFIKLEADCKTLEEVQESAEVKGLIGKLEEFIIPNGLKQRNLDLEVGGLESTQSAGKDSGNDKEVSANQENSADDVWDERSQEVKDMNVDVFNSTGMKSVVWKKKKDKKEEKQEMVQNSIDAAAAQRAARRKDSFANKVNQSRQNNGNNGRGM